MDVQPATANAVVEAESQPAIDALRRLVATRAALAATFQAQPSLSETSAQGTKQLLAALPGFWSSRDAGRGSSHAALLASHLTGVMREGALLRRLDGTLGDDAASLVARATSTHGGAMPTGMHACELMLGNAAHAGSLILLADDMPGVALLFTAHGGWEAFDSLDRLLESTRRRLLESVSADDDTRVENDSFAEAKTQGTIGYRDIAGNVFTTLANRMIEVQAGRIALAADDYDLDSAYQDASKRLGDRVRYELSPAAMLDIDGIESLREARLLETVTASRLTNVPANVRAAWYEARDAYSEALSTAGMLRMITGARQPLAMRSFASKELAARLATLGIDESPEAITIEIARIGVLPAPLDILDPLPGSTETRRMSLVDFACQNIGRFSLDTLHAVDAQGASLRYRLGDGAIRAMVRDLDLANRHQSHIEEHLRAGTKGAMTRKLAMAVNMARMRLDAAEACLSYYLPGEPRSFIDDRDERGFRWVEAALDKPAGQRQVDRHDIVVSQLTYRQVALDGIVVFGSGAPESAPRIVMYTPDAPDGLVFREFDSRQIAARRFLYHPAFREYLLDRLPAEFASVSANGVRREFAGDRLAHWVLGASSNASYTLTAEPFGERPVTGDFLAAGYDATVEKYRRDTRFLARSTADADKDALFTVLQTRLNVHPAGVAADMMADVPASLARMMQASWRFYDHVKAGDTGQAFVAFAEGYANALNLAAPPFIGGRHIGAAIVRSRAASRGVATPGVRMTPLPVHFEDRYAVPALRKAGKPDADGIVRLRGQSYIQQDGTYYLVRHDGDYGRWRLAPPRGAIDIRFTGPLIERIDGRWVYAHDVGLRGGMRRIRERFARVRVAGDAPPAPAGVPTDTPPLAPAASASPPFALPAVMEPHRAEISAAVRDNPSAAPTIRPDGTRLQFTVQTRSALIVDPSLHPDIAELSAHQRRTFLHELDTRFPLVAERTEVLSVRGWAQYDGRRVPSPPPSPTGAGAQGPDIHIQSPSISSSTGDPSPPVTELTPSQQRRWEEALAAARHEPRSPQPAAAAAPSTDTLPTWENVPGGEWPDRIWYFSPRRFEARFLTGSDRRGFILGSDANGVGTSMNTRTYPVSVVPPETPINRLSEALGTSPIHQAGLRDPIGYWLQIDLRHLRRAQQVGPHHIQPPWGLDVEMRRRLLPNGDYQYALHSGRPIRVPFESAISTGRRGEPAGPMPPR